MASGQQQRVLITGLTNTAQTVFAAGSKAVIQTIIAAVEGASDRVVLFQSANGAVEFFRIAVKGGSSQILGDPGLFFVPATGVRVLTTAPAGDVSVSFVYIELP